MGWFHMLTLPEAEKHTVASGAGPHSEGGTGKGWAGGATWSKTGRRPFPNGPPSQGAHGSQQSHRSTCRADIAVTHGATPQPPLALGKGDGTRLEDSQVPETSPSPHVISLF